MKDGLQLVGENPETDFILTHTGMLTDLAEPVVEEWKAGLRTLAKAPNLYAKLSGLGTFVHRNDPELIGTGRRQCDRDPRQRPADVRLQLPDREAVDQPCRADRRPPRGRRETWAKAEADIFWNTAERVYRPA